MGLECIFARVPQAGTASPYPHWLSHSLWLKWFFLDWWSAKLHLKMTGMPCLIFQNCLRKVKAKFSCTTWNKLICTLTPLFKCIMCSSYQWEMSLLLTAQSMLRTMYTEREQELIFLFLYMWWLLQQLTLMHLSRPMWRALTVGALVFSLDFFQWRFSDTFRHLWAWGFFNYCLRLCTQSPLVFCRIAGLSCLRA